MFSRPQVGGSNWDPERAEALLGRYALVGLTFTSHDGQVLERAQRHGRVVAVERERGIAISVVGHGQAYDGELLWLPPDLEAVVDAEPGDYGLPGLDERVSDPDLLVSWVMRVPPPGEDRPEWSDARRLDARRLGFLV